MNDQNVTILDNAHYLDLPSGWRVESGKSFNFTRFRGIFIARYKYEDRRALIFSGQGDLAITLNASAIRPLAKGLLLHMNSSQAVKIEEGGKIFVPERPE
ncbi:hypothetical protein ES703_98614 [subsurface metagenome]